MLSFVTTADAQSCELGGVEFEPYALEITNEYLRFGAVKICIDSSRPSLRINNVQLQPCCYDTGRKIVKSRCMCSAVSLYLNIGDKMGLS
jgi:hypothetical protein